MAFDPDAYLAKKAAPAAFDPDAYLAKRSVDTAPTVQAAEQADPGIYDGLSPDIIAKIEKENPHTGRGGSWQARQRAANLERLRLQNPYEAQLIEETSGPAAAMIGVGRGFVDVGKGAGRLVGAVSQEEAAAPPEFDRLASIRGATGVGRVVGQAAPFVVPGLGIGNVASLPARVALSSGLGASEGGLISAGSGGSGEEILKSAAVGAALGGGAEMALPLLNRAGRHVYEKLNGKPPVGPLITAQGQPTQELQQVLTANGLDVGDLERIASELPTETAGDIAANARRAAAFEKLGLKPTEAQRTRSPALFSEQVDMYRSGDPVITSAVDAQNDLLSGAVDSAARTARQGATSGDTAYDVITNRATMLDEEVGNLYRAATESVPEGKLVPMSRLADKVKQFSSEDEFSAGVVSAVKGRMREMGILDKKGNLAQVRRSDTLMNPGATPYDQAKISVVQSEKLRQYMNELYGDAKGRGRRIIGEMKDALDEDVFSAAGQDYYQAARAMKTQYESELRKAGLNKFDKSKTSLVRDILESNIEKEDIFKKAVSAGSRYKARDLQSLKDYLLNPAGDIEAGTRAWNNLRADALNHIKEKAFIGPVNKAENQSLTRAGIERAFKSLGDEKMKVIFSPAERKFLGDLAEVAKYREPPPGISASPSGPEIKRLRQAVERIFGKVPWIGDVVEGYLKKRQTKAAQQRITQLVDDAARLEEARAKSAFLALRKSRIGETVGAAPFVAAPLMQQDQNNQ